MAPDATMSTAGSVATSAVVVRAAAAVNDARERLARHASTPASGSQLGALATDLFEAIVLDVYGVIADDLAGGPSGRLADRIALVAHGGFGRREMAPYSDVDLMVLTDLPARGGGGAVAELSGRLLKHLFDAGLEVGQSVRTPAVAAALAWTDATVYSSLVDARLLAGNGDLLERLVRRLRRMTWWHPGRIAARLVDARRTERQRHGGSVAVLEPNVKRSAGALRDVQLVRWLGEIGWGERLIDELAMVGGLTRADADAVRDANDFLLRLRFEMHLAAGRSVDELTREEQLRIAAARGIESQGGLLGVERFMREYFSHTRRVARIADGIEQRIDRPRAVSRAFNRVFGHRIDGVFRVGSTSVAVPPGEAAGVAASLPEILRLFELGMLFNKPVEPETLEAVRAAVHPGDLVFNDAARRNFLALFDHPSRLADSLRKLHDIGVLDRIVPQFAHATGLMQFNSYHKYAVDEHCILAVERAAEFDADDQWLGEAWDQIRRKRPLLLALLLHDLGKGFVEDHSVVGAGIAREISARLRLPAEEAEIVEYLVANHLMMAHLAFRRNTHDQSLVVRFARDVGSPEMLRMLAVLTAADVSAVGPGTWTRWKADLLGDLYARTMDFLDGENPSASAERNRRSLAAMVDGRNGSEPIMELVASLPPSVLQSGDLVRVAEDLGRLASLPDRDCFVRTEWQPDTATIAVTVGTREDIAPGVFHRLTGALSTLGLEILAADIHTLGHRLVLDRFIVQDHDFAGEPHRQRLEEVEAAIRRSLEPGYVPSFSARWVAAAAGRSAKAPMPARVRIDNESSDHATIVEVFAHDAPGLLYAITKTIFESGLSVQAAKVGTYLDQVVDAFHVTDASNRKIDDAGRLERVRIALEEIIGGAA